jgi:hypothetical protein
LTLPWGCFQTSCCSESQCRTPPGFCILNLCVTSRVSYRRPCCCFFGIFYIDCCLLQTKVAVLFLLPSLCMITAFAYRVSSTCVDGRLSECGRACLVSHRSGKGPLWSDSLSLLQATLAVGFLFFLQMLIIK